MRNYILSGLTTALLCLPLATLSAAVPGSGLKAEGEGRWNEAIAIYQLALERNPAQAELWQRLADIYASQGNNAAALDALARAAKYAPGDAPLQHRLSQEQAVAGNREAALAAINRALALQPNNPDYLKSHAELANWNEDYASARESYRRLLGLRPDDPDTLLALAHTATWMGDLSSAAAYHGDYDRLQPDNAGALLEYIEVEAERGRAQQAIALGDTYRHRFGESPEYWLRMADLFDLAGDSEASGQALERAGAYAPDNAALYFKMAQTYAAAEDLKHARRAIERAVTLEPDNIEYLRNSAELAAWDVDYPAAQESYQRILVLAPEDAGALLNRARIHGWQGESDAAIDGYKTYLARYPDVQIAWMEYIALESEVGNYAEVMELLEAYKARFDENLDYTRQKARTLAWANRPTPALAIVDERLPGMPDDYALHYTRAIALHNAHRPREALATLDELARLQPESKDTRDITRYINTPLRSRINLSGGYYTDSDKITIRRLGLEGVYVANPESEISLAGDWRHLNAPLASGFENSNGQESIVYTRAWIGARHLFSPDWSLDGRVGNGSVEDGDTHTIYGLGADIWPMDNLTLRLSRNQDIYAVSPRAVSLEVMRTADELNFSYAPDLRWTIDGLIGASDFSDGNARQDLLIAPRRAVLRNKRLNLDLGVSGQWLAFDTDPGNGYYAPSDYKRYALNAYSYWKLSDDDGISLTLSLGGYDDNLTSSYRFSGDVAFEAFIGLYRDWMLDVRGTLGQNIGVSTGAYRASGIEFILTRRF